METQPLLQNTTGGYGGCGDQVHGDGGGQVGGGDGGGQVGGGDGRGQVGGGDGGGQVGGGDGRGQVGGGDGRGRVGDAGGANIRGEALFDWVFYFFCFFSGQLMLDFVRKTSNKKQCVKFFVMAIIEFPVFILFLLLHAGVLAFNFYAIFGDFPSNITHGYTSGAYETKRTKLISSITSHMVGIDAHYKVMLEVVFTMSTLSGSLSYLIMTYVLVTHYSFLHTLYEDTKSRLSHDIEWSRPYVERHILNPFPLTSVLDGHREYYKREPLCPPQSYCFFFIFLLNMILFAANVYIPFQILDVQDLDVQDHIQLSLSNKVIYNVGFVTLFSSQYGTIISCFIFSKVAYAVTIKCNAKMEDFQGILTNERVNTPQQEENVLNRLQDEDKAFYDLSRWSMKPYRFWFTIHWFFYAVTAFLSIGFLVEIILHKLYGTSTCDSVCRWCIGYIFLFTLEHTVLFLYPCFRAASILAARNSLIKRVCIYDIPNLPTKLKAVFVQYMKERKCGFELSILCARIEFGFSIAYISIFLGLIGIVIKLSLYN